MADIVHIVGELRLVCPLLNQQWKPRQWPLINTTERSKFEFGERGERGEDWAKGKMAGTLQKLGNNPNLFHSMRRTKEWVLFPHGKAH